jgi:hypothetical protein
MFINLSLLLIASLLLNVNAQQFVFPKNGQSAELQQQDEYSCHSWAVTQTGVDPTQTQATSTTVPVEPTQQTNQQGAQPGSGIRGAVGGAAAGAIIAEIGDNDVSNGAAKGAAIGAISSRRKSRRAAANQEATQQAAQQEVAQVQQLSSEQLGNYNKARNVCLDAKGYSVSQ